MKSIGLFWTERQVNKRKCDPCPYNNNQESIESGSSSQTNSKDSFDLQINLWNSNIRNTTTGKVSRFMAIDFGVVCPLSTKKLVFLFPFEVKYDDFHDLVKCLSLDTDLLCTMFNEDLKSTSEPAKSYHTIDGNRSGIHYLMYELSNENIEELKYDSRSNLTQLTIVINSNFDIDKYKIYSLFLRFRIKLKSLDFFAKKKEVSNDWLQSAFSSTYMFDIRLNDVRELSKKRKEFVEHQGFHLPTFNKVHFFYMADSEENVVNGSTIGLDKRLLENDRWHSYLGDNLEFVSENIAHHWKKKKEVKLSLKEVVGDKQKTSFSAEQKVIPVDTFTIFFKTEFSDFRLYRVIWYLLGIVVLGVISSSLVSLISSLISNNVHCDWLVWLCITILLSSIVYMLIHKASSKR